MWAMLLKFLAGGGISAIGEQINRWQSIKAKAQNDHERLEADKMLAELEAAKQSVLAAQHSSIGQWVRVAWAAPFLLFNAKVIVYDKVLGLGTTDALSPELLQIQSIVLAGYFIHATIRGRG